MIWLLCSLAFGGDLDGAWKAALESSDQAALVRAEADLTGLTTSKAMAAALPRVAVQANGSFNQYEAKFDFAEMIPEELAPLIGDIESEPLIIQRKAAFDASLSLIQPIVDASAWAQISAAKAVVQAGRAREAQGLSAVRVGVAQAYWAVIVSRRGVEVAEQAAANARGHHAIITAQVKVGTMPKQALLQAELAVSRADREVAAARAQRRTAEASLGSLTGWPEDEALVVPSGRPTPQASLDEAVAQAQAARPEVKVAAANVAAARRSRTAADLAWVPDVSGRFTEIYNQVTGFVGKNWYWNAGINLSWTLFDGGYTIANQRDAAIRVRMAQSALDLAKDQARIDAQSAWDELGRAREAYTSVQHEIALATENLRLAELQLREGLSTFQDVDDARLNLQAAELGMIRESMSVDLATIRLMNLTGQLGE